MAKRSSPILQSSHARIATTARPAAFNADRIRVTSAGLNPDLISAVWNAEFGAMWPLGGPRRSGNFDVDQCEGVLSFEPHQSE